MDLLLEGLREAWRLIRTGDRDLLEALGVSLTTSALALGLAALLGVPFGAWLALARPRGGRVLVFALRLLMAVPTVVIGLVVWALLTRRGLLGSLGLLYTQAAMTLGLTLLALPILASHVHAAVSGLPRVVVETARALRAGRLTTLRLALGEVRPALVVALLTSFFRCFTELGIALIVGGNVRGHTRNLPGAIQLDLSRGELGRALAAGLVLLALAALVTVGTSRLARERRA